MATVTHKTPLYSIDLFLCFIFWPFGANTGKNFANPKIVLAVSLDSGYCIHHGYVFIQDGTLNFMLENVVIGSVNKMVRGGRVWVWVPTSKRTTQCHLRPNQIFPFCFCCSFVFRIWNYAGLCLQCTKFKTGGFRQRHTQLQSIQNIEI